MLTKLRRENCVTQVVYILLITKEKSGDVNKSYEIQKCEWNLQ